MSVCVRVTSHTRGIGWLVRMAADTKATSFPPYAHVCVGGCVCAFLCLRAFVRGYSMAPAASLLWSNLLPGLGKLPAAACQREACSVLPVTVVTPALC